jgi:hypothetical protein
MDFARNFALLSMLLVYVALLLPVLLLALAIPYAVLRLRAQKNEEQDPQLGLRTALHFFFSLSVLLVLNGLTIIAVDFVRDRNPPVPRPGFPQRQQNFALQDEYTDAKRAGVGLILGGVVFGIIHLVLLTTVTRDRRWPEARRLFNGWRLAIHGLVILAVFTWLMIALQQRVVPMETVRSLLAALLIWVPAWTVDLVLLRWRSRPPRMNLPARPISVRPFAE